ncbi:hypothetical protein [Rhodococcus wratislaviensis]|uniref:hypothetical protein n=1 Tax=Rhodococcus wratislaviensis TaxID=44752 RepID=UPI000F563BC2|nr:hypothetical protein [Rhodococcus wratislaviensis]
MEDHDPLLESLGLSTEDTPVPDDVWNRALEVALDPQTPEADGSLVPEMNDTPVVPEDELILDLGDIDDGDSDSGDQGVDVPAEVFADDDHLPDIDPTVHHDVSTHVEDPLPDLELPEQDFGHDTF